MTHPIVRWCIILSLAFFTANVAKAEYVDLSKGGMQISPVMRCDEDRPLACVIVEFQKKVYLVVHDQKGEYKIFIIENNKPVLIWGREMI